MPHEAHAIVEGLYRRGRGHTRLTRVQRASSREEPGKDSAGIGQDLVRSNALVYGIVVQRSAWNLGGIVQKAVGHAVRAERECFRGC